jgi:hypothetical protein
MQGLVERYIIVYKVVHEDNKGLKRSIVFKSAKQLARYLNPVDSMKYPFKVYKKKGN